MITLILIALALRLTKSANSALKETYRYSHYGIEQGEAIGLPTQPWDPAPDAPGRLQTNLGQYVRRVHQAEYPQLITYRISKYLPVEFCFCPLVYSHMSLWVVRIIMKLMNR